MPAMKSKSLKELLKEHSPPGAPQGAPPLKAQPRGGATAKPLQTFTKIMRPGARLVGLGQMLSPQSRTSGTGNKETAGQQEMDVDVEVPALGCRQLVPDGDHQASYEDDPYDSPGEGEGEDGEGEDSEDDNPIEQGLRRAFKRAMTLPRTKDRSSDDYQGAPIEGNIYRYWAMMGGFGLKLKKKWQIIPVYGSFDNKEVYDWQGLVKACGMFIILPIQIFAPLAIFFSQLVQIDPSQSGFFWSSNSSWCPEEDCVSWVLARMLGFLFMLSYIFWAIFKVASERADWLKISALLTIYEDCVKGGDNYNCCRPSKTKFYLHLGPWINCYMYLVCGLSMCLLLKLSVSPTDVVFNSLAVLFIMKLDDSDSDLAVLQVDDWDPAEFGKFLYKEFGNGAGAGVGEVYGEGVGDAYFQEGVYCDTGIQQTIKSTTLDPRREYWDIDREEPPFDLIDDPDALIKACPEFHDHKAYIATRICLWGLLVLLPFFWIFVTLVPQDGTTEQVQMEMKKLLNLNLTFYAQDAQGQMSKVLLPATWALGS